METKIKKEPLLRITRNMDLNNKHVWLIRIGGILAGFLICALMSTILAPGTFFDFFKQLGVGSFGTPNRIFSFLEEMALLLIISLALAPAFRMKFWNIGAEGQVLAGCLCCYMIMRFAGPVVPSGLLWILMIACSVGGGVLWAAIPAIFKAFFNTNETLFTLMMNYLAKGLILYFISVWEPGGTGVCPPSPYGNIAQVGGYDYIINIIIVALVTVIMFVYLKYTKHGYEIDVVGGSVNTARYIGINVKKVVIRTMILSGAVCGLAGLLITAGATHTINGEVAGGRGFTAVLIAWLGNLNPFEMALNSGLVAFITKGANEACSHYFQNGSNYSDIMVGVFFFSIIASTFFTKYKIISPRIEAKKLAMEGLSENDNPNNTPTSDVPEMQSSKSRSIATRLTRLFKKKHEEENKEGK